MLRLFVKTGAEHTGLKHYIIDHLLLILSILLGMNLLLAHSAPIQ
jgi:hypothetical protein